MSDLNSVAIGSESWVITLLPSSGANEPEFPTQFHIEYGGVKGDESFSGTDLLVKDIAKADVLFTDIESTMEDAYGFKTDRQRYHNTSSPNIFLRKLEHSKKVNGFVLRIAWSVFLWNSRKMEIAQSLADILNRNIRKEKVHPVDNELKVKNIGYSDYKVKHTSKLHPEDELPEASSYNKIFICVSSLNTGTSIGTGGKANFIEFVGDLYEINPNICLIYTSQADMRSYFPNIENYILLNGVYEQTFDTLFSILSGQAQPNNNLLY
jgi:hypothetical protein